MKAQIQMMETVAVIFVFFILMLIGFVFYTTILKGNLAAQKEESLQLNAIEVAQRASSLPELQCSKDNIPEENCIDILKLQAAQDIMQENQIFYFDRLLFSRITVDNIYPSIAGSWPLELYDRDLESFTNVVRVDFPINLYDPLTDKKSFGIMTVEFFER